MAKVITVSQKFPAYHPKAGQRTYFIEQIWGSLFNQGIDLKKHIACPETFMSNNWFDKSPKHHTVRLGRRWKTGDMASIRVWGTDINPKTNRSGPYHSKQIIIAPDVEVIVNNIVISCEPLNFQSMKITNIANEFTLISSKELANNDGLELDDFENWFNPKGKKMEIEAQIICWNKNIKY